MKVSWQHVAIVFIVLSAVVTLSLQGQDTSALLSLAMLLFVGIGLVVGNQQTQRDQTNGTMKQMLEIMEGMSKQLAEAVPPKVINGTFIETKEEDSDAVRNS
jgi:hypothetical protein